MHRSPLWLTVAVLAFHLLRSSAVNVSLPISSPSGSQSLARTLVSFSIEQDRWPDWSGVDSRNELTYNALTALGKLTGEPPKLRVGADSEDHTFWSPTVTLNEDEFPPANTITPYPEATQITVGNAYYELSRFLPRGTHMTWGINLGANNVTNAVNIAQAIVRAFRTNAVKASGVILDLIEIGNEADLFRNNGLRPSNWTVQDYVPNWISIAGPAVEATDINGPNAPVAVQGAAFAGQGFTPTEIFNLGILDSAPGKAITQISQHRYSAAFCNGGDFPLTSFMSKQAVRGNLTVFNADIAETHSRGLTYVLGETNSIACHGAPGVSNTAGAALWTIDYTLQAATLGIKELFFHEGIGYKYNFLQPISLNRSTIDGSPLDPPAPPHIQPGFYGGLFVNSFIGSTGLAKVVELDVDDSNVSGYAVFEDGVLVRAVFVNLYAWLASSTGVRPAVHIDLDLALGASATQSQVNAFWGHSASLRRLVIDHADDTEGLTWAGQSYETSDVSPEGSLVTEQLQLSKGFDIRSTEAVLVEFATV
ncbi:glycoside hydrolase family 79 protein [Ganoderma leucocontextum]|nr:glycoside hydrolase family 79 protein [Ganoderma leucocontextum]